MKDSRTMQMGRRIAALFALLVAAPVGQGLTATWTVCPAGCDETTIQAAVLAADPGDTIQILAPSPHTEGDISLSKDIVVEGQGAGTTIVQASAVQLAAATSVFVVDNGSMVTMRSLTVRFGGGNQGAGLNILDGDLVLESVDVVFNDALVEGGGVYVASGSTLDARDSTISDNSAASGGGIRAHGNTELTDTEVSYNTATIDGVSPGNGGGIYSSGNLVLRSCEVTHNAAYGSGPRGGGLLHSGASLVVVDSSFMNNVADEVANGGGAAIIGSGRATLYRAVFMLNESKIGYGGGLDFSAGQLVMVDCTLSGNSALVGGGLNLTPDEMGYARLEHSTVYANDADISAGGVRAAGEGTTFVVNSTVTANSAVMNGGGIYVNPGTKGSVEIASATITDNTADSDGDGNGNGGGVYVESGYSVGMRNTIVAGNHDGSSIPAPIARDCAGTVQSAGYNLIQSLGFLITACTVQGDTSGNLYSVDPLLLPFTGNGGPTGTHALDFGSPAIDGADPAGCSDSVGSLLLTDQRHGFREDRCDIGAYEKSAVVFMVFFDAFESGNLSAWSSIVR